MTSLLNPYLAFRGEAAEAMEFYRSVFGGELTLTRFGDFGMEGAPGDWVMHAHLTTPDGFTLMGSDVPEHMELPSGRSTISLSGDETEKLRGFFTALGEGGRVEMPLTPMPWGDEYGTLTDRYGVPWMANVAVPQG